MAEFAQAVKQDMDAQWDARKGAIKSHAKNALHAIMRVNMEKINGFWSTHSNGAKASIIDANSKDMDTIKVSRTYGDHTFTAKQMSSLANGNMVNIAKGTDRKKNPMYVSIHPSVSKDGKLSYKVAKVAKEDVDAYKKYSKEYDDSHNPIRQGSHDKKLKDYYISKEADKSEQLESPAD